MATDDAVQPVGAVMLCGGLLALCLTVSGCATTAVLKDAALAACGSDTVYLSGWWAKAADQQSIQVDPMGGYQFAYWIDEAGNACHGEPGRNGQLGPAVVNAFRQQAYDLASNREVITEQQLKSFQQIPVSYANYSGSGLHFAQFNNTLLRLRSDSTSFKSTTTGVMSIPEVTEIGSKACVAPAAFHVMQTMFVPTMPAIPAGAQDPDHCKLRALPTTAAMSEDQRKQYDAAMLPHGTEIFNVP
ncbi:MAG: hypothetical protein HY940_00500 [Gammaproteobacteria bacterium]|nr:hypothetical protein [Gammaproteobacteria bacterium]